MCFRYSILLHAVSHVTGCYLCFTLACLRDQNSLFPAQIISTEGQKYKKINNGLMRCLTYMQVHVSKRKRQCKQTETYDVSVIWQRITTRVCDIIFMQSFCLNIYVSLLPFSFFTFYLNWQTSPCDSYALSNFPFIFKHIFS
jgi:hypothetical protein